MTMTHSEAVQLTAQFVKGLGLPASQHAIWLRQPTEGAFEIAVAMNSPVILPDSYFGLPIVRTEMA